MRHWRNKLIGHWGLAALLFLAACTGNKEKEAEALIGSVKETYAPDKRTALFDISVEGAGPSLVLHGMTNLKEAKDALLQALDSAGIGALDSVRVLPGPEMEGLHFGVASLSVCNLRGQPSHSAELVTQVLLGTPLKLLRREGDWLLVQTPESYLGWTPASGIARMDSAGLEGWRASPRLIITGEYAQAFASPDTREVVSDLVAGNILLNKGIEKVGYKIGFPDGRSAWLPAGQAEPLDEWMRSLHPDGDDILRAARRMMGVPYLWGGTSVKGVDCSGFTKTAYFMNGLILPRDASQQVHAGARVDIYKADTVNLQAALRQLQAGDLIFFTNDPVKRNRPDARITHVGIYMGDGEFIHSSGMVHISSLMDTASNYSQWHALTMAAARRILGVKEQAGIIPVTRHPLY